MNIFGVLPPTMILLYGGMLCKVWKEILFIWILF